MAWYRLVSRQGKDEWVLKKEGTHVRGVLTVKHSDLIKKFGDERPKSLADARIWVKVSADGPKVLSAKEFSLEEE